jgi:hypothetical protein
MVLASSHQCTVMEYRVSLVSHHRVIIEYRFMIKVFSNNLRFKAVEVVEKAMKNDHLMSQPIVDPQYPHFTDKKIMKLRQSGDREHDAGSDLSKETPGTSSSLSDHGHSFSLGNSLTHL